MTVARQSAAHAVKTSLAFYKTNKQILILLTLIIIIINNNNNNNVISLKVADYIGHYPVIKANYCYTELAVSSLAVAETIAILIAPTHGGMTRLSRPGWLG